ncbi:MAG: RNA polymerase subunit sigma-70 [Deltaproteobacteria bacterium]|nr:RNA polymerase subunit sigma-70 [Deltaproteobacteria bacterium]
MDASHASPLVERVAREAYGRLVASLAVRFRDIHAAEDAVGDALRLALERWPTTGVPDEPIAWLSATAKNQLLQRARHDEVVARETSLHAITAALEERNERPVEELGDERLRLMFVCAHPAIDESVRTALMLQTVLGLDAEAIGRAFLVPGATMGQRLVRAKRKIRDAAIPFEAPEASELASRLHAVIEGIYAAFATDDASLVDEAMFLAELLATDLPEEPEALALLALVRFRHARRAASRDEGRFVPLAEQDTARWDRASILSAEDLLRTAASLRRPGPFQIEAAIQSAHCQRLFTGQTPWRAIVHLYGVLARLAPTTGSTIAEAVGRVEIGDLEGAALLLDGLGPQHVAAYAPYWLARAHLADRIGDATGRSSALERAIELTSDATLRAHLRERLART